jgi:hypothetical protein
MPSHTLLERISEEVRAAELVHNFPSKLASSPHGWVDETVEWATTKPWFLNQWQAALLAPNVSTALRFDPRVDDALLGDMIAETSIFGCHPFEGAMPTWAEASDRLIYIAHNLRRIDTGSNPHFGDVGAVFSNAAVRQMVLIASIDTGIYEGSCNRSASHQHYPQLPLNCSYGNGSVGAPIDAVGTLDDHTHLLLDNLGLWSGYSEDSLDWQQKLIEQAAQLFGRSPFAAAPYDSLPPVNNTRDDIERYWESNLLGNPPLPAAVKFLLPVFGASFGTDAGRSVQALSGARGWPLLWALGDGTTAERHAPGAPAVYASEARLLDPTVAAASALNATAAAGAAAAFERVWATAAADRAAAGRSGPNRDQIVGWWKELKAAGLQRLAPLTARACADLEGCVGVDPEGGECVCWTK